MVAIIGADGFIGSHVTKKARELGVDYLPVVFENVSLGLKFEEFLESAVLRRVASMIIVAGNSNHELARVDFMKALHKDINYLLQLDEREWDANVVFLSSAAVYYGREGLVDESMLTEPDDFYGLSKFFSELVIKAVMKRRIGKLLIFRLTNAFGVNPNRKRFFDKVLDCLKNESVLTIYGDGGSYISPIRVERAAEILVKSCLGINNLVSEKVEVVNLCSFEPVSVIEIVHFVEQKYALRWKLEGTEVAPVKFQTSCEKLKNICLKLNIEPVDALSEIAEFLSEHL